MEIAVNNLYKHKYSKNICKIIEIDGDTLKCVYPPDSYVFSYKRDRFEQFFRLVRM